MERGLRELREEAGLTQEQVAGVIAAADNRAPVTVRKQLILAEMGGTNDLGLVYFLSVIYGVDVATILSANEQAAGNPRGDVQKKIQNALLFVQKKVQ